MGQSVRVLQHGKVAGIGDETDAQSAQQAVVQVQVVQQEGTVSIATVAVDAVDPAPQNPTAMLSPNRMKLPGIACRICRAQLLECTSKHTWTNMSFISTVPVGQPRVAMLSLGGIRNAYPANCIQSTC